MLVYPKIDGCVVGVALERTIVETLRRWVARKLLGRLRRLHQAIVRGILLVPEIPATNAPGWLPMFLAARSYCCGSVDLRLEGALQCNCGP